MLFYLKQIIMTFISVLIQISLTISFGIHKTECSVNLFSGRFCYVETSHLICEVYGLTGFFAVGCLLMGFLEETIFCLVGTLFMRFFTFNIGNF